MKVKSKILISGICLMNISITIKAQVQDNIWTLQKCIDYALEQNISIQKSVLTNQADLVNLELSKAARFPSVNASVSQNFDWSRSLDNNQEFGSYAGTSGTNYGINSGVKLYNGFKLQNSIRQNDMGLKASQEDIEALKESTSLNVLNAYLQVLYAKESVNNSEKQIVATTDQLRLAEERLDLGAISKSDYLQVKSELASEKLTLANAQSLLTINKVSLMQLMELPVSANFDIEYPDLSGMIFQIKNPDVDSVYQLALTYRPEIKSAELNRQVGELSVNIAKSAYQPSLSLSGGISTNYSSNTNLNYDYQVKNKITPYLGLSLAIPIYQNREARSGVQLAKINSESAHLSEKDVKNQLRKSIEQACTDVLTAQTKYNASVEQFASLEEAYLVAEEKYNQGLINSIDFLIQKTNYINGESQLLQSKYNLVFSMKILDYYQGKTLTI